MYEICLLVLVHFKYANFGSVLIRKNTIIYKHHKSVLKMMEN